MMERNYYSFFLFLLFITVSVINVKCTMDLTNYKLTWEQDFTTMSNLSVSPWGPVGDGML